MRELLTIATTALTLLLVVGNAHADPYPEEIRKQFMQSCSKNGENKQLCACILNKMEGGEVSLAELKKGDVSKEKIERLAASCLSAGWPEEIQKQFMKACVQGAATKAICRCTMNKLQGGLVSGDDLVEGNVDQKVVEKVAAECARGESGKTVGKGSSDPMKERTDYFGEVTIINRDDGASSTSFRIVGLLGDDSPYPDDGEKLEVTVRSPNGDASVSGWMTYSAEGVGGYVSETLDVSTLLPWDTLHVDLEGAIGMNPVNETFSIENSDSSASIEGTRVQR